MDQRLLPPTHSNAFLDWTHPELVFCVCVLLSPGNLGQTLVPFLLLAVDKTEGPGLFQQVDAALKATNRDPFKTGQCILGTDGFIFES